MGMFSDWLDRKKKQFNRPRPPWHGGPKPAAAGERGTGSRQLLSADQVENFVYGGEPLPVSSSNVASATYALDEEQLTISYLDGAAWQYSPVTVEEALDFARALSKGTWVWDNLKVRGTVHQHQKTAVQVR